MLEKANLSRSLNKTEFKKVMSGLNLKLAGLQRVCREKGIPVAVIFEGWDAAGKGALINRLMLALDPRGYKVYPIHASNEEESMRPYLWRFWVKTPARGRIAIFDRSWYGRVLGERVNRLVKKSQWQQSFDDITSFERQLADDGTVVIKFFLHISKKEQKKRFKTLEANNATSWKVTKDDWKNHRGYNNYAAAVEDMLVRTDTGYAPWTIIESTDHLYATVRVFEIAVESIQRRISMAPQTLPQPVTHRRAVPKAGSILDNVDTSHDIGVAQYEAGLKKAQHRIFELEHEIYRKRIPVILVFEGWDASGKGGAIRRLVQGMDPRGFEVVPIAAPNDVEKAHHYLWRFWMNVPKAGHIAIFDRSWYGRVMVERVERFCSEDAWQRAYNEINQMEAQWIDSGAVVIKFWLHIDKAEQLRRFKARQAVPGKRWKITEEDWRNRKKWDQYRIAVDEMLQRTSTPRAPWTVVAANSKQCARLHILTSVVSAIEARL